MITKKRRKGNIFSQVFCFMKDTCLSKHYKDDCISCQYFKKYIFVFLVTFFLLLMVFGFNLLSIAKSYAYNVDIQISYNIEKYEEIEFIHLCKIANCKYVYSKIKFEGKISDSLYLSYRQKQDLSLSLNKVFVKNPNLLHIFGHYYMDDGNNIVLYNDSADAYFALDLSLFIEELKYTYTITFTIVYFIVFLILYLSLKRQQHEHIMQSYGTEAILSNQSMIMITENVHHELNTPLEVIENKLEKIKRIIQEYILGEFKEFESTQGAVLTPEKIKINNKMVRLTKDFDFVHLSLEQVFNTLERMRGFKHLKYSNGNKTLYDICEGACQIMIIRNSGFDYEIDPELKNYKLRHNSAKDIKNVDFLNVLINHLKNSLEAKSSILKLEINGYENRKLHINIIDNGNGIPENFIDNVFKPNFSTKSTKGTVRGNGMYLNKYILNNSGGDVDILDSNENGTIVEIIVPCDIIYSD